MATRPTAALAGISGLGMVGLVVVSMSEAANLSAEVLEPVEMAKDLTIPEGPMGLLLPMEVAKNLLSSEAAGMADVLLPNSSWDLGAVCCSMTS